MNELGLFEAPPNQFGIIGSTIPLSDDEWQKLLNGPIAAMEPDYQAELAKVVSQHMGQHEIGAFNSVPVPMAFNPAGRHQF